MRKGEPETKTCEMVGEALRLSSVLPHKRVAKEGRELWLFRVPANFDISNVRLGCVSVEI